MNKENTIIVKLSHGIYSLDQKNENIFYKFIQTYGIDKGISIAISYNFLKFIN